MRTVKIAQLKAHVSGHLRTVEQGGEVVVTHRRRPIARIVPVARADDRPRAIPPTRAFAAIRDRSRAPADWRIGSTELLREKRRTG